MKEKILTSEEIAKSWANIFCFKKEKGQEKGLRSPQIGALHALMAHIEDDEKTGIVVMPTGTGKTETMLSFLVANQCRYLFWSQINVKKSSSLFHLILSGLRHTRSLKH